MKYFLLQNNKSEHIFKKNKLLSAKRLILFFSHHFNFILIKTALCILFYGFFSLFGEIEPRSRLILIQTHVHFMQFIYFLNG